MMILVWLTGLGWVRVLDILEYKYDADETWGDARDSLYRTARVLTKYGEFDNIALGGNFSQVEV